MSIKEDNKSFIKGILEGVQTNFNNDGFLAPATFIIGFDKKMYICPAEYDNDEEKRRYALEIKHIAKEVSAISTIFISEAWALKSNKPANNKEDIMDEIEKYGSVSKHPGRREVIMISEEYSDGENVTIMIPIYREGEKVTLGTPEISDIGKSEGVFGNMLNKPTADDLLKDIINA